MSKQKNRIMDQQIGAWLRAARLCRGYSLKETAILLGITYQQVQKYEKGTNRISVARLLDFSEAVGVAPESLLERIRHSPPNGAGRRNEYRAARVAKQFQDKNRLKQWLELGMILARSSR